MTKKNDPKRTMVYICHDYNGEVRNYEAVSKFISQNIPFRDGLVLVSPIHAFDWMRKSVSAEILMAHHLELLDMCDFLFEFGSNSIGKICEAEKQYAREHRIPIVDILQHGCIPPDIEGWRLS